MKQIENYIHLYLGCEVQTSGRTLSAKTKPMGCKCGQMTEVDISTKQVGVTFEPNTFPVYYNFNEIKPILIPLPLPLKQTIDLEEVLSLLHRGFDLFGLIEAKLAIDGVEMKRQK